MLVHVGMLQIVLMCGSTEFLPQTQESAVHLCTFPGKEGFPKPNFLKKITGTYVFMSSSGLEISSVGVGVGWQ